MGIGRLRCLSALVRSEKKKYLWISLPPMTIIQQYTVQSRHGLDLLCSCSSGLAGSHRHNFFLPVQIQSLDGAGNSASIPDSELAV